jgi:hypothetical protein
LTKREYTMHDHNTLLKEFLIHNEGKLKKLQDDAKIAQVMEGNGSLKSTMERALGRRELHFSDFRG